MKTVEQKLSNTENLSAEEIQRKIEDGATFKVFRYRIGVLALSLDRFSPAILISNSSEQEAYRKKYNRMNYWLGWFYLRRGPFNWITPIRFNNKGGMDVTLDIVKNLENYDSSENTVKLEVMDTLFRPIAKSYVTEVKKATQSLFNSNSKVKSIWVGEFINVEDNQETPFIIGINAHGADIHPEEILEPIYKRFQSYVSFEVIDQDSELFEALQRQGSVVWE
ncbi:MAG: hypothetical protein SchgKO_16670 [Schleiferiaceae bacterium]